MDIGEKTLVGQDGPFQVWVEKGVPDEIVAWLETARFGTEGAIYEHLGTRDRVAHMHEPFLASATLDGNFVACMVMCKLDSYQTGKLLEAYYIRYFFAHPKYKGKGLTKKMSILFIEQLKRFVKHESIFFAALEGGNKRSTTIVERVGFRPVANVKTIGFSRFFPKKNKRIERISEEKEQAIVIEKLADFYLDHALVHFHNIFQKENYYVIREEGEIVAGVQLHKATWRIKSMPGLTGKLLMNVVPYLPLIKEMVNPYRFHFITFEGIYYQPGKEHVLFELFEGLLAMEKLKTAIFWLAENSRVYEMIAEKAKLGLMNLFVKDAKSYIAVDGQYLKPENHQLIKDHPPYISTFDFI